MLFFPVVLPAVSTPPPPSPGLRGGPWNVAPVASSPNHARKELLPAPRVVWQLTQTGFSARLSVGLYCVNGLKVWDRFTVTSFGSLLSRWRLTHGPFV